jgi:phenylacetate-coenzyme A ligase PaaK-like adenylate-forming protein
MLMHIPHVPQRIGGKTLILRLGFLQTQNIRRSLPRQTLNQPNPKTYRINIPSH